MPSVLFPTLTDDEAEHIVNRCEEADLLFNDAFASGVQVDAARPDNELLSLLGAAPFAGVIARVIQTPRSRLLSTAPRSRLAEPEVVFNRLTADIVSHLHTLCCRPLSAEMRSLSSRGMLRGDSPESRYSDFQQLLLDPDVFSGMKRAYPLLIPTMAQAAEQRFDYALQVLIHLHDDAAALTDAGLLTSSVSTLELSAGDSHCGGRTVVILHLADGSRLVYKPRSLSVDRGLARTLAHVNKLTQSDLRAPEILTYDDHGWMEFITAEPPAGHRAEDRYFEAVGQLLAVLVTLGATDMHFENVVATRSGPVVIDAETLLHPRLAQPAGVAPTNAATVLADSVGAVGLLPLVISNHGQGIDVGAVGFTPGTLSPFKSLVEKNPGRDDLIYVLERLPMPNTYSGPGLPSEPERIPQIIEAIQRGFVLVARAICRDSRRLARRLPEFFKTAVVRYLHNPTSHYAQLLRLLTHQQFYLNPEFRRQGLARVVLTHPEDLSFANAECRELAQGDVPLFSVAATDRHLRSSTGDVVAVLPESPLEAALRRLRSLDESAISDHLEQIAAAFIPRFPEPTVRAYRGSKVDPGTAWQLAKRVGEELLRRQHASAEPNGTARWLGPLLDNDDTGWQTGILSDDLYTGVAGPGLVLAGLSSFDRDPRWETGALAVFEPIAAQLNENSLHESAAHLGRLGVYTGVSGLHWALAEAGNLLGARHLLDAAFDSLPLLQECLVGYDRTDHLDGLAGILTMSLRLQDLAETPTQFDQATLLAMECAQGLANAHEACSITTCSPVYSGFAHGLAGISTALHLATTRGIRLAGNIDSDISSTLHSMYDHREHNWWRTENRDHHGSGWCHGAPGIALQAVLLCEQGAPSTPDIEETLHIGAGSILRQGIGRSPTWCHGDPGNIDILHRLAIALNDRELEDQAKQLANQLIGDLLPGWLNDPLNRYRYTPNLMLGTAGIAWFALRTIDPQRIPSPLSLI